MHLRRPVWLAGCLLAALAGRAAAQTAEPAAADPGRGIDVDILFNYYSQDGERSPVTGGIGTEDLQVVAPLLVVGWRLNDRWTLDGALGLDSITSASTDNIDDAVSSASRNDVRAYTRITATREVGDQSVGLIGGFSSEYDYRSILGGLDWSRAYRSRNTTLGATVLYYADTVELYDIDGVKRGSDGRETADLALTLTQVLGRRTVGEVELGLTSQSGFLSTPFHEVILAPTEEMPEGEHVAERLPDSRMRTALGLRLNHAFTKRVVQRLHYRFYDDDWGITGHTLEAETHLRLPTRTERWIFPILRFHTQTASDYFAPPGTAAADRGLYTADPDLAELTSRKLGLGFETALPAGLRRRRLPRSLELRLTRYTRDDGFESWSTSWGLGWSF